MPAVCSKILRENLSARVVVTGCYATHAPQELQALSPRVEVYSNRDKDSLPACLGFEVAPEVWGLSRFADRARAFVKIQDGCRAPCRYCIIPQTRPTYTSKPVDHVLKEIETLTAGGYGEIVLTGIRLGLYHGRTGAQGAGTSLVSLLSQIIKIQNPFRVRLSSLEVTEVTDDLIATVAGSEKLCPHFHIPLQSADDGVLQDMGRWYRFGDYQNRVLAVRSALPHAGVTADVLVGYPTETEASFQTTLNRVEELALSGLHAFPYSPRPGTPAALLSPWPSAVLQSRVHRMIELSERLKSQFQSRFAGTLRPTLSEGNGHGWTDNYIRVAVPDHASAGCLVSALVEEIKSFCKKQ